METRSNKILVFAVVGLVLAAVIAFSWWLTASKRSTGRQYDIVLEQSVSGLLAGSPVTYSGVPVGRILSVQLDPAQAGRVRVRIDIFRDELPIPQGTVAKLTGPGAAALNATFSVTDFKEGMPLGVVRLVAASAAS